MFIKNYSGNDRTQKGAILILGATSSIGRAMANAWAQRGHPLFIASRDLSELSRIASDIKIRYDVPVFWDEFDALKFSEHPQFFKNVVQQQGLGDLAGMVVNFGDMKDHHKSVRDFEEVQSIININFTGACSILMQAANYFEQKGSGFIIGISSVAGDFGRETNTAYSAAKAGLSTFLQGMRNRLYHCGVHVMTVKPGYVDTPMIYGRRNVFLAASPQKVGEAIVKASEGNRNVIYVPWFWRPIAWMGKLLPEYIKKRLHL